MNSIIDQTLQRFLPSLKEHLPEERLVSLICGELSFVERWMAERHLKQCQSCFYHRRSLEGPRAQHMIELYAELASRSDEALAEKPRAEFSKWLRFAVRQAAWQSSSQTRSIGHRLIAAMPGVSAGVALGAIIAAVAISALAGRNTPKITANSLLVHAERWDVSSVTAPPGVAHQVVRIKTPRRSMDLSLYWDIQGRRKPRHVAPAPGEEQIELSLKPAGIDWERPISASSYQEWHDHQHIREDHIARTGTHLLTLATSVPEGAISQESITIRDTDFHPVERTVGFRDHETVEISELDYSVLPWNAVDAGAFEPLQTVASVVPPSLPGPHLSLSIPDAPSMEQLDETELATRMILNQLHADQDEQMEVRRSDQDIEVVGLVATDDRKRELVQQLMTVPRVRISILSEADLKARAPESGEAVSVESAMLPDTPSALESYLRGHNRTVEEINDIERQLFEGALVISKESRSIVDLKTRFFDLKKMPVLSQAEFEELLYSHCERLEAALAQERRLLAQAGAPPVAAVPRTAPETLLLIAADRNLAFIRELTQNSVTHPRSAEEIFADVAESLESLSPAAREAFADTDNERAMGEKE